MTSEAVEIPSSRTVVLSTLALVLVGIASTQIHRLAPLGALGIGSAYLIWRFRRDPASIAGILILAFCLAPFLRRVADFRFGFTPSSFVLAAPYLPIAVMVAIVLKHSPGWRRPQLVPVMFSLGGVLAAYCIGLANAGIMPASISLLQYLAGPMTFLVICLQPERFDMPRFRAWIGWIALVSALYGLYQYAVFPPWEKLWLESTKLLGAAGQPEPFGIRTWSTLNSMSPFSYFMAFALIALPQWRFFLPSAPFLALALASTMGRSAWGTTALGWLLAILLLRSKARTRLVAILGGVALAIAAAFAMLPGDVVQRTTERLATLTNLKQDNSFASRVMIAQSAGSMEGIAEPVGRGLGSTGFAARVGEGGGMVNLDNGFIALAYTFGWIGSFLYFGGFFGTLILALRGLRTASSDSTLLLAATSALFAANIFENGMSDFRGTLLWAAVGAAMASRPVDSSSALLKRFVPASIISPG